MDAGTILDLGFTFIVVGTIIIVVAILLVVVSKVRKQREAKGAGIIIVGPFPIVIGTDKESVKTALILAIVLTALLTIITIVTYLTGRQ